VSRPKNVIKTSRDPQKAIAKRLTYGMFSGAIHRFDTKKTNGLTISVITGILAKLEMSYEIYTPHAITGLITQHQKLKYHRDPIRI
jgi:hypothetical protein